jgi:hypothetical protein
MNETLKKFSDSLKKDFEQALVKNTASDLVSKIKAASDAVEFSVVVSTADEDRQGDTLDQSKWNLDNFKANPVVLWAHDYQSLPIGACTSITVKNGELVAEGKFAPAELNPFAAQVAGLYQAGFIKATSVGFMIHESGELELLEFSFVPVPANPYALSMRQLKKLNLNTSQLVMKGIRLELKAEQAGDRCEMDDGTPGVLAEDADNPGTLVCVPPEGKSKSNETQEDMNNELSKNLKAESERHGTGVAKAISEFSEKSGESKEGADNTEAEKAIEEFKAAIGTELDTHNEKCMKAIDDAYALEDQKPKKSIDEFKSAFTAEHSEHVKAFAKAIDEYKAEDGDKAIDDLTKKAADELGRHGKAQTELCKAEFEEKKSAEEEVKTPEIIETEQKSGRAISAANKEKIKAVIKSIEDLHAEHGKSSNNVIAALKDLMGPDGNEGEEHKAAPEKPVAPVAPKNKVEVKETRSANDTFEAFMATRQVLRTVDIAVGEALKDLNTKFREKFPTRK